MLTAFCNSSLKQKLTSINLFMCGADEQSFLALELQLEASLIKNAVGGAIFLTRLNMARGKIRGWMLLHHWVTEPLLGGLFIYL
jgi:hypothetical protein